MIGVIAKPSEVSAVQEFFQLFKTPWEFYVKDRKYDVVVASSDLNSSDLVTDLLIIYSSEQGIVDPGSKVGVTQDGECRLEWHGTEFPIYGAVSLFGQGEGLIRIKGLAQAAAVKLTGHGPLTVRVGYDLFQEITFLLSQGQPAANASIPTLEIHISFLRQCLLEAGICFVEVPPVPTGFEFMACLTHDVDFVGIRSHRFDHTMWGFLFRALFGSPYRALSGKMPWRRVVENWKAALSLPLVFLGLKEDLWIEFDRYMAIERGLGSTFFFIPYRNDPGEQNDGPSPRHRAAKYDLDDVRAQLHDLVEQGCEVGLHGIDAWRNTGRGRRESNRIGAAAGRHPTGIRMHWLYFDKNSPKMLEDAGFVYDSTFGYNEAIGFRPGTAQAFLPLGASTLLELPLSVQDTALFYPGRMNLSETAALKHCAALIGQMSQYGGSLTVNWHTRSLSPERLWKDFYLQFLAEIQAHAVYFDTAEKIVAWFRKRRELRFLRVDFRDDDLVVEMSGIPTPSARPSFVLRVYSPQSALERGASDSVDPSYTDVRWNGETELRINFAAAVLPVPS